MKKTSTTYIAKFDVIDVKTGILVEEFVTEVTNSTYYRARHNACRKADDYIISKTDKLVMAKSGATAEQLQMFKNNFGWCYSAFSAELKCLRKKRPMDGDTWWQIQRVRKTPKGSEQMVFVKDYDSLSQALDDLYRKAHRYGYKVAVDNTASPCFGFLLSQIYVQVGEWRYFVTEETTESYELFWGNKP